MAKSMITVCPGCGRRGIMAKATGKCFHCNKGKAPPKGPPSVATSTTYATPSPGPRPSKPKRKKIPPIVGGRVARG